jgi:hypothetical protein
VPEESEILPGSIRQYDMASHFKMGGESSTDVERKMDAAATFLGIQREAMEEEEVYVVRKAASMNINQWNNLRTEWKKGHPMVTNANLQTKKQTKIMECVNYLRCMFIGNSFKKKQGITMDDSAEIYTSKYLIKKIRDYYGGYIELDPASCSSANKVVQARRIYRIGPSFMLLGEQSSTSDAVLQPRREWVGETMGGQ